MVAHMNRTGMEIKPAAAPNPRRKTGEKVTLRDYLADLVGSAFRLNKDGTRTKTNPALANFLTEHHLERVWNGSPVWRRRPEYYNRKAK